MARNGFIGLPVDTLTTLRSECVSALSDIMTSGQTVSVMGRQFSMANISEIQELLANLTEAIDSANGRLSTNAVFRFNGNL